MRLRILCLLWLLKPLQLAIAQDSIAVLLKEIEIETSRFEVFSTFQNKISLDSIHLKFSSHLSLGQALGNFGLIHCKNYGPGSMASMSVRGGTASQSSVQWGAFSLNNPSHGIVDLSLIPTALFEEVSLAPSASAAVYGNCSIGGIVQIGNNLSQKNGLSVGLSAGSFGNYSQSIKSRYSHKKLSSAIAVMHQSGANNFSFINTAKFGAPSERMSHASFKSLHSTLSLKYQLNSKVSIGGLVWAFSAYREIPASMTSAQSFAYQSDKALRAQVYSTQEINKHWRSTIRYAAFLEQVYYVDPKNGIDSKTPSQNHLAELEQQYQHEWFLFNCLIGSSLSSAQTEAYPQQSLNRASINMNLRLRKKISPYLGFRKEWTNQQNVPLLPSFGLDYLSEKGLSIGLHQKNNYRLPNLNDLYWNPGGNPNLKPEQARTWEATLQHSFRRAKQVFNLQGSVYLSHIQQYIQWLPSSSGYWTAQNLGKVESKGFELVTNYLYKLNTKAQVSNQLTMSVNRCYQTEARFDGDASVGKQLIYSPFHTIANALSFSSKRTSVLYNLSYTSHRFTSSDHSERLEPYLLHHVYMAYKPLNTQDLEFKFHIENILNTQYQVIAWRPMPGRTIGLSILYSI